MNPSIQTTTTDVLVAGAGPTGLALALALVTRGLRPIVIDRLGEGANTSRCVAVRSRNRSSRSPTA